VRGMGLVWGLEMVRDRTSKEPDRDLTRAVIHEAFQRGLAVIAPIGMLGNVIRVAPPLVMTEAEANESLDIFEAALKAAAGR
jgi:4-aminobutyrate aminotransferase/(S)-3-amino-2-methylpropionate transaminase